MLVTHPLYTFRKYASRDERTPDAGLLVDGIWADLLDACAEEGGEKIREIARIANS